MDDETDVDLRKSIAIEPGTPLLLEHLPLGSFYAVLDVAGEALRPAQRITLTPEGTTSLVVTWPAGGIEGHLGGVDGVGGAEVSVWPMRVSDAGREYRDSTPLATQVVAEDGAFAFTGLEAGRYLVTAESEGRNGAVVVALAADEARSVRLDLASGTTLAVRVVRGGAPVADAVVTAVSQPYANVARVARSGDDGGAELAGLTRGDYSVEAVWRREPATRTATICPPCSQPLGCTSIRRPERRRSCCTSIDVDDAAPSVPGAARKALDRQG